MAVDTAEKRFSIMGLGQPTIKLMTPTGSVNASQRATMIDLYSGITLSGAPTETELDFERGIGRGVMRGISRGVC